MFSLYYVIVLSFDSGKGNYARTRANDFKHLPALILNIFLRMFDRDIPTNKIKFHVGFL